MRALIVRVLVGATFSVVSSKALAATIVDLDGTTGEVVTITLFPGTYVVTPIGMADGGAYNAYNASNDHPGNWVHAYTVSSPELGSHLVWNGHVYDSDLEALAAASVDELLITFLQDVDFFILDSSYADNEQGVSLSVAATPEPSVPGLLLLSGAAALLRFAGGSREEEGTEASR